MRTVLPGLVLVLAASIGLDRLHAQTRPLDDVVLILSTAIVQGRACAMKPNGVPLATGVRRLGYELPDFVPDGRYGQQMDAKIRELMEQVRNADREAACRSMDALLRKELPDVYRP